MQKQIRSALFVPATRPERFVKALAAGADAVIIDLEDAVERQNKDLARNNLTEFAQNHPETSFLVRINDATTSWFQADLAACRSLANVSGILLPKAESDEQIKTALTAGKPVLPIIESAKGVLALGLMAAVPGVERLSFGGLDLMLDLGITPDTEGAEIILNQVRGQVLLHGRAAGLDVPLDGVHPDFSDHVGLGQAAARARDMGFGGMLCIHPAQIALIHSAFAPTDEQVQWAGRVLDMAQATGSSAFQMDGKMVDLPVIERARRIMKQFS